MSTRRELAEDLTIAAMGDRDIVPDLTEYLDLVDQIVNSRLTDEQIKQRCRAAIEAAGYTWTDTPGTT